MANEQNFVALVAATERYIFIYDDESIPQVLEVLARFAAEPELAFNWSHAHELSMRVREMSQSKNKGETG